MADANVIREYLVGLGFKVDDKSLKNFEKTIEDTGKAVFKMAAAIETAALAIGAGVAKFAEGMDTLYFASKRNETSVKNIKAVEFAAKNLGATAEEARGSIEGLSRFMRENPGSEDFIASLGVDARDGNGKLKEKSQLLEELGSKLAKMPWFQAKQYGNALGISDNMLRAIQSGDFSGYMQQFRETTKNTDFEAAAEKARKFEEKLTDLQERIKSLGVTIGSDLIDALGPQMESAAKWFKENGDDVSKTVSTIGKVIVQLSDLVLPILSKIGEGWKNIYDWVKAAGEKINELLPSSVSNKIGAGTAWLFDKLGIRGAVDKMMFGESSTPASSGSKSAYSTIRGFGWSHEQAAGILANLNAESGMNPGAVGDNGKAYGIAQWHPDRQAAFAKWSGKDIRKSTLEEQLAFMNYELTQGAEQKAGALLRATKNAQAAGEVMSRHYERPLAADAEASKRGAAAVQISQTTQITVAGGDPIATGRAVAGEQNRVNVAMARNMQTAIN
ncbi:MAG: phage tail tip lysozyme [Sulfuricella sp.]